MATRWFILDSWTPKAPYPNKFIQAADMNNSRIRVLKFLFLSLFFGFSFCDVQADELILAKELLKQFQINDPVISTDGKRIAVVVTEPIRGDQERSSIWLYDKAIDQFRQLTTAGIRDSSPRWSPDGNTLGFLSERNNDKPQIFLLPMSGGEARQLSNAGPGVGRFEWSPDGNSIAYLAEDEIEDEDRTDENSKDDERVVSEDFKAKKLWQIELASKQVSQITGKDDWTVADFAWLPNNKQLVVSANNSHHPELYTDELYVVDRAGGRVRGMGKPDGPIQGLQVSPGGQTLAYIGVSDGGPSPHDLYLQPIDGGTARNLTASSIDRQVVSFVWQGEDSIILLAEEGFGSVVMEIDTAGDLRREKSHPHQMLFAITWNTSLQSSIRATALTPPELWVTDEMGERQVSNLHPNFPKLVSPELFRYSSSDGMEIEAALFLPTISQSGPMSLITLVHGGPTGRWSNKINAWAQLLAARGYAVFAPNVRGSTGYGLSFIRSNRRDWGGGDYRDVLAGIDSLVERGVADPDRLGIGGWSYGGYMSAWAITQTDRFKVAVIGAPMTDLAVEYGTEIAEINAYDTWFLGTPYENLDDFIRMSPMTHIRSARTPSLILVGEEDEIDPPAQCWQFYRGLRRYNVEAELVIYPRELHNIKEELHQLDVLERMTGWFDRFLN